MNNILMAGLANPQHDCEEKARLALVADDHIPATFSPVEITSIIEQFT